MYRKNVAGNCPYCLSGNYDATKTEARKDGQDCMFCNDCQKWSVRKTDTLVQYPTDEPENKEGYPSAVVR